MRDLKADLATYGEYLMESTAPGTVVTDRAFRAVAPESGRWRSFHTAWFAAGVAAAVSFALLVPLALRGPSPEVPDSATATATGASATTVPARETTAPLPEGAFGWGILATTRAGAIPALAACPGSTDPDRPGSPAQARPPAGDAMGQHAAFDAESGVIVYAHPTTGEVWLFDVCTNTWRIAATTGSFDLMLGMVYDIDSDRVVGLAGDTTWIFDTNTDTATIGAGPPDDPFPALPIYDPVSGLIVVDGAVYDVDIDTWTTLKPSVNSGLMGYDYATDRMIFASLPGPTTLVDPRTGSTTNLPGARAPELVAGFPPVFPLVGAGTPQAVVHDLGGGQIFRFDSETETWLLVYGEGDFSWGPGLRGYDSLVYDSLNGRLVGFGGIAKRIGPGGQQNDDGVWIEDTAWVYRDDVWAIDIETGELLQLVPQSGQ